MDKVFVIGMYKSGTSWLLECLAAHPEVAAIAELDLIKVVNGTQARYFEALPKVEVLKNIFGRSAFMNLSKDFVKENAQIYDGPPERLLTFLREAGQLRFKKIRSPIATFIDCMAESKMRHPQICARIANPSGRSGMVRPVTFDDVSDDCLEQVIDGIWSHDEPMEMLNGFIRGMEHEFFGQAKVLVMKGADQVARFDLLNQWMPNAKKIAIVRDGRDACISAYHFRTIMQEKGAAYMPTNASVDFAALLKGWCSRAQMLIDLKGCANLKIIRYEDLQENFESTMTELLDFLGLSSKADLVTEIQLRNSFRVVTGRKPGRMAKDIRRGGVHGEWRSTLTEQEKQEAWRLAGEQLEAFGYDE